MKKITILLLFAAILNSCSKDDYAKVNKGGNKAGANLNIPNIEEVANYRFSYFKDLSCQPNCSALLDFSGQVYKSRSEFPLLKSVGQIKIDGNTLQPSELNHYYAYNDAYLESFWQNKGLTISVPSLGINEQVTVGERLEDVKVINGTTVKWTPSPTDDYNAIYVEGSFTNFESVMKVVPDNGTFDISPYIQNVKKGTVMDIRMRRGNYKVFKDNKGEDHLFYWTSEIITNFEVQ